MDLNLLEAWDVSISFGGLKALDRCSITVKKGEIHSLIGPNGAGKTTFFNIITGIYKPDHGRILFKGVDITAMKSHEISHMGISRTFQNIELFPSLNPVENVMVGMHRRFSYGFFSAFFLRKSWRNAEAKLRKRAEELLCFVGLSREDLTKNVKDLPYGLQKKVELARALSQEPELLLLDEPSGGLNPEETESLMRLIENINRDMGITLLLVEHDMKVVMGLSHTVTVLHFGRKIAEGTPEEIQRNEEVIRAYLGEKKAVNS